MARPYKKDCVFNKIFLVNHWRDILDCTVVANVLLANRSKAMTFISLWRMLLLTKLVSSKTRKQNTYNWEPRKGESLLGYPTQWVLFSGMTFVSNQKQCNKFLHPLT